MLNYTFIPVNNWTHIFKKTNEYTTDFNGFINTIKVQNPPVVNAKPDKHTNGAVYVYSIYDAKEVDQLSLKHCEDAEYPNKYTALLNNRKEIVLWKDNQDKFHRGRCDNAITTFNIFKLDVDEQLSPETYDRVKKTLDEMGVQYVMHTSSSNGKIKDCKIYDEFDNEITEDGKRNGTRVKKPRYAYGFRVYIPYTKPIPNNELYVHIRNVIYNDMRIKLGFDVKGINSYDSKASHNLSQLMVPPYILANSDQVYNYDFNTAGMALDWSYAVPEAIKQLEAAKTLLKEKEARSELKQAKKERFKLNPSNFHKRLDFTKKAFVGDYDKFIDNLTSHLELHPYTYGDKHCYTCECPNDHDTNNSRKLMIIPTEDGIKTTCFGTDCPYNNTDNFINDYNDCIPHGEDIDNYVEIQSNGENEPLFRELIGQLSEHIPSLDEESITMIQMAPGGGKTHNITTRIHHFLRSTDSLDIEHCPILLVVVPTQRLQDDLLKTYSSNFNSDLSDSTEVTILRSGVAIKKKSKVIITVQTYVGKMGHTTADYKLIKFLSQTYGEKQTKRNLLTIIDEADTFIDSLQNTIQIGYRINSVKDETKLSSMQEFDIFHRQCPTARLCSYQCDRCKFNTAVEIIPNEVGILERRPCVTTSELRYIKMKHNELFHFIENDGDEVKATRDMGEISISPRTDFAIAFDNKAHICKSYKIDFKPVIKTEPDTFIEWVATETTNAEIIRVNDDKKHEQYDISFAKMSEVEEDEDGSKKRKLWFENYEKTLETKLKTGAANDCLDEAYDFMLPYHPCASTFLRYYDTDIISRIFKQSKYVLCLSGTYNQNQLDIYKKLLGDKINMIKITPEKENKPIDELLIMTTTSKIDINAIDLQETTATFRRYIDEASPSAETYRDEIGFHLHIDHTKSYYEDQKKKDDILHYFGFLQNEGKMIPAETRCYKPSLIRTYAGSPYTRGANLGEYQSITYNFFSSYDLPMYALNTFNGDEVGFLREGAKVTGMLQALFRIMRKKKDQVNYQITQHPNGMERRVMMVGDCKNVIINPKSTNTVYDYTRSITELIRMKAIDVTQKIIDVNFEETSYLNSNRLFDAMLHTRTIYLSTGRVEIREEKFDESILLANNGKFMESDRVLQKYPNLLPILNINTIEFEKQRKFIMKLMKLDSAHKRTISRFNQDYVEFELKFPISDKLQKKYDEVKKNLSNTQK